MVEPGPNGDGPDPAPIVVAHALGSYPVLVAPGLLGRLEALVAEHLGASRVVLIADVAKFSMTGVVRVCGPESIDHVVTDAPLPAACRSAVDAAGIEVTIA